MLMKQGKDQKGGLVVSIVKDMDPNAASSEDMASAKAEALQSMYENMKKGDFNQAAEDFKTAYDLCYDSHEESEGDGESDDAMKNY